MARGEIEALEAIIEDETGVSEAHCRLNLTNAGRPPRARREETNGTERALDEPCEIVEIDAAQGPYGRALQLRRVVPRRRRNASKANPSARPAA